MTEFEIRQDEHGIGEVLILKGDWDPSVASYMQQHGICALRLSDYYGFKGEDLSFLSSLWFLKSLEIYCWDAKGVQAVGDLPHLEVLGLQFRSTRKIDFSGFSRLRVAMVTWTKGLQSLLEVATLEKLNIQNYPHIDLTPCAGLSLLRSLYLTSRKIESLSGIESLKNLEVLDLYNCPKLASVEEANGCPHLQKLEIEACTRLKA
ncbi:leucine-rich repeat domain-containing protein [Marinobacter lutaoensis]|nr:leucine-rich repeat domain-containing protein [Marinobacter lutaoensis]